MATVPESSEVLTRSVQDYLKTIYRLTRGGTPAATTGIARSLDLSPPSVSSMVKRLSRQGLLEHMPYRGVELTAAGVRIALRTLRRHRILETYLVAQLGYTWDTVHEEAERLEHAVSDQLIDKMARALGDPPFDPHGDPIPSADGTMMETDFVPLPEFAEGDLVRIRQVATHDPERLRYLASRSLKPGATVKLVTRQPFDGPITVRRDDDEEVVGHELARLLMCTPVENA